MIARFWELFIFSMWIASVVERLCLFFSYVSVFVFSCFFLSLVPSFQVRLTNKGYAFVEFSNHEAAAKARQAMQDKKVKVCDLAELRQDTAALCRDTLGQTDREPNRKKDPQTKCSTLFFIVRTACRLL